MTINSATVILSNGQSVTVRKTVTSGDLYSVLPDQFTTHRYKPYDPKLGDDNDVFPNGVRRSAPAPCVFRTGDIEDPSNMVRSDFTNLWQYFAIDLLAMRKYGLLFDDLIGAPKDDIIRAFNSLYASDRAFTNDKGVNNRNNYITNVMRGEDPKIDSLICGDDVVQVLETRANSRGVVMGRLYTFRQNEVPPPVTPALLKDPRVLRATIINENGLIRNFDQLKDQNWVPYPYIASRDVWYPMDDLKKVN